MKHSRPIRFSVRVRHIFLLLAIISGLTLPVSIRAELVDRVAAVVNNDIILQSEFVQAVAPLREKLKQEGYSEVQQEMILAEQRPRMLEQMIMEKLTDQQVEKHKIQIDEAEVGATIGRIQRVNGLTDESMRQMLELDGMSFEAYRAKIKEQLLRTKLVNLEVKSKIIVTDADIRAVYEKSKEQYAGKTQYHLRHILLKVAPESSPGQREQVLQKMRLIQERLKAGETFAQMAIVYSEAGTASQGGDLGYVEARMLAAPIRQGLKDLQNGQVSSIIDTEQGYQLFLLENVQHSGGKTLEEAKPEIQERLYAQIVDEKFQKWLNALRERAHIQVME